MSHCQVSIVVPTYCEAENIPHLCHKINQELNSAALSYEIIISDDDSKDGTIDICNQLHEEEGIPVRLLTRTQDRGLSLAVIDGIAIANGDAIVVMDADLSHPAEKIPEIANLLLTEKARFVVGSRYTKGGGIDKDWPIWRHLNSLAATLPARYLVPLADPMSGFFGLCRKDMPAKDILSPIGYKIGLELCVKGAFTPDEVKEVSINFSDRLHGTSKMNFREQVNYLRHLRRLYHHRFPRRMELFQFILVGGCGLIVDLLFFGALLLLGTPHLIARGIAFWPAVTFNWFFNRIMTFKARPLTPPLKQWSKYAVSSGIGFLLNWGTYALLTTHIKFFETYLILALFVGVLVGTVFNFLMANTVIFKR